MARRMAITEAPSPHVTPREGVAFVGPFTVTNASSIDLRIIAQPGLFAFRILSIRAVSAVEEDRIDTAPIDGKSPYEVAAYVDKTLNRGQQLASWRDGTMNGPLLVSSATPGRTTTRRSRPPPRRLKVVVKKVTRQTMKQKKTAIDSSQRSRDVNAST